MEQFTLFFKPLPVYKQPQPNLYLYELGSYWIHSLIIVLVLAGSAQVSLSLNTDIVENYYRYTSEHSCIGEIGYPDAGFLSLTAIHPTSGETVVYNEEVVTDAMKVKSTVGLGIYDYGVTLADDFGILIREDRSFLQCVYSHFSISVNDRFHFYDWFVIENWFLHFRFLIISTGSLPSSKWFINRWKG